MADIDLTNLAEKVKRRLDELFPDEPAAEDLNSRESSLLNALKDLGGIAEALQWKVPLGLIRQYLRELTQLQPAFAGEKHIRLLIKVQSELCRYMLARRRQLNPQGMLLLLKSFDAMQHLAGRHRIAPAQRQLLVRRLLTEYLAFKRALLGGYPSRPPSSGRRPVDPLRRRRPAAPASERPFSAAWEKKAYYLIPVEEVERLRGYILADYNRLRALLQRVGAKPAGRADH